MFCLFSLWMSLHITDCFILISQVRFIDMHSCLITKRRILLFIIILQNIIMTVSNKKNVIYARHLIDKNLDLTCAQLVMSLWRD